MIDLSRRDNIRDDERILIVTAVQSVALEELILAARWRTGDAAFHGGSAIKAAWAGLRHSEDLDFMVTASARERLTAHARPIIAAIRNRIGVLTPGATIEMGTKAGKEDAEDIIDSWTIKWGHPKRIGKIAVKLEFYRVWDDSVLTEGYQVEMRELSLDGRRITGRMPVGNMLSLWADKLKAMATRPEVKWRDVHDIAYLVGRLGEQKMPDTEEKIVALGITGSIYKKSLGDIRDGLIAKIGNGTLERLDEFTDDMSKWFSAPVHATNAANGTYEHMLDCTRQEMHDVIEMLDTKLSMSGASP